MTVTHPTPPESDGLQELIDQLTPGQRTEAKTLLLRVLDTGSDTVPASDTRDRWSWVGSFEGPSDLGENHREYLRNSGYGEGR